MKYSNTTSSRKLVVQQEKKRYVTTVEPLVLKRLSSADDLRVAKIGPAMEKVTILRRGESLDSNLSAFFPFLPYFFAGAFLFVFEDDIYLFFSRRH